MSNAHKGSSLHLSGCSIPIDQNTIFLAHYDISTTESLSAIMPISDVTTIRKFEGYYGGTVAIEESTTNLSSNPDFNGNINSWGNGDINIMSYSDIYNPISNRNGALTLQQTGNTNGYCTDSSINYNSTDVISVSAYFQLVSGYAQDVSVGGVGFYSGGTNTDYTWTNSGSRLVQVGTDLYRLEQPNLTFDTTKTATTYQPRVSFINNRPIEINVFSFQIEKSGFCSSYVNGSRNTGILSYSKDLISPDAFTVSAWVKLESFNSSYNPIFELTDSNGGNNRLLLMFEESVSPYNKRPDLWFANSSTSGQIAQNTFFPTVNQWAMITVTYDGTTYSIYANGSLLGSKSGSPFSVNSGAQLYLGGNFFGTLNGIIDEFRIDRIARSAEEIEGWYISQRPFFPKGILRVAY